MASNNPFLKGLLTLVCVEVSHKQASAYLGLEAFAGGASGGAQDGYQMLSPRP